MIFDDCLEAPAAVKYSVRKKLKRPILLKAMALQKDHVVLDVGSGAAALSRLMAPFVSKVVALDKSPTNTKIAAEASKDFPNIEFAVGSATKIPFPANTFDRILASEIIEHIRDDAAFLREIRRVLKPGGLIVCTTLTTNPSLSVIWVKRLLGIHVDREFGHMRGGYTPKDMKALAVDSGLVVSDCLFYDTFLAEIAWIITTIPRQLRKGDWKDGQDQKNLDKSIVFQIYKLIFPLLIGFAYLDKVIDFFFPKLIGHHILLKLTKEGKK